jgi:hypothetical protein
MLNAIISKLRQWIKAMNEAGVPLPMIRESGRATLTGTMTFLSFNTALLGQLGKFANLVGDVDLTQANYLFGICLAAYLGRKMQGNGTTKELTVEKEESK